MILLDQGGHLFASLSPAADDKAVASSAVGLQPLRTRRTALSSRRGPVSNQATRRSRQKSRSSSIMVLRKVLSLIQETVPKSRYQSPFSAPF
jgi:hypothetical protein